MKTRYLFLIVLLLAVFSCNKDSGGGLNIKLVSVNSNIIPFNGDLVVTFNFTDNAGHPIDTVYMHKTRINQDQAPTLIDSFYLSAPSYNGTTKGQLQLDLGYNNFLVTAITPPLVGNPPQDESDSLIFQFVAKDVSGHVSDTVTTGLIVVQREN